MYPMQGVEQDAIVVSKMWAQIEMQGFFCDSLKTHQAELLHAALVEIQGNTRHFHVKILANA